MSGATTTPAWLARAVSESAPGRAPVRHAPEPRTRVAAPVLLLGGTGMLGRAWRDAPDAGEISAPPRAELDLTRPDLTDPGVLERLLGHHPRTVINCSGWTDVDAAEHDQHGARILNARAPAALAAWCRRTGSTLVHFSTDYVFAGDAAASYAPAANRRPLNVYGRTKAEGEDRIRASGCDHLIVRTSWLFAPWGRNFPLTIARLAMEKPSLKVVRDQHGRPTYAPDLVRATAALLAGGARGTFHVANACACTWYDLAVETARRVNPACIVEPCSTSEFPRPAPRPAYSVLDITETEALIGPMRHWRSALAECLQEARLSRAGSEHPAPRERDHA